MVLIAFAHFKAVNVEIEPLDRLVTPFTQQPSQHQGMKGVAVGTFVWNTFAKETLRVVLSPFFWTKCTMFTVRYCHKPRNPGFAPENTSLSRSSIYQFDWASAEAVF